ncbi:hypothetical protein N9D31_03020 [Oligoflexaceae bacterium]|nr:hypothetical protein [Oligoflexaceae bacterium]
MNRTSLKLLLFISLLQFGCSSATLPEFASSSKDSQNSSNQASLAFGDGNLFGDGSGSFFETGEEGGDFVYPVFYYKGNGSLAHREGSNVTSQAMTGRVEKDAYSFTTTEYRAISGDHTSDVNEQLQDKVYGKSGIAQGNRESAEELKALEASDSQFSFERFFIYANDIENPKTNTRFTFSKPVPVTMVPGSLSRYAIFKTKPVLSYSTTVSGRHNFTLNVTATVIAETDESIEIEMVNNIVGDSNCTIASDFPLPKSVTFVVNTTTKNIVRIRNYGNYNDDGRCYSTSSDLALCKADKDGEITDFNGGC